MSTTRKSRAPNSRRSPAVSAAMMRLLSTTRMHVCSAATSPSEARLCLGGSAEHVRSTSAVATAIKRARTIALLPYLAVD